MTAALMIKDLAVTYPNGHQALRGVSLRVEAGESLGVVGVSGSGKSTLLRAVLGLLPPGTSVQGRVEVGGRDLLALSDRERRAVQGVLVGYVAQDPFAACDPLRRVRHHVSEAWEAHGQRPEPAAIDGLLTRVGITDPAQRTRQRPHQWSGGMLQRATTVAATAHDPVLTLADEPSSALDTELADDALNLLRETCSALVVVTHDLALAARHTDRLIVLVDGRIAPQGDEAVRRLRAAAVPRPRTVVADVGAPVVSAQQVERTYRLGKAAVKAVRSTDLVIHAGEVVGIVGPSGSGKSTLLRLLCGMERPDAGTLVVDAPRRKGWAMPVFQDPVGSLDARWPLWRTLTEPLLLAGDRMSRRDRRDRARRELDAVGLHDVGVRRRPGSLSVGQCQRVAIARALVAQPQLLAADEPTASLDVVSAQVVSEMLRTAADRGAAVLVVSHDEARLRSYADRVLVMRDGRLR